MRKKILLVDDTEFYRNLYHAKLASEGYEVVLATNGAEAVAALAKNAPDIVLLDLMMPVMDGYKVLETIQKDETLKKIPVIVFTAKGASDEIDKAFAMGAHDFMVKATSPPKMVVEKIRQILGQKG